MKQAAKKYGMLLLVLAVIAGVCLLFSSRKSGLFIDEVYTFGLSNSYRAPFLADVKGGSLEDTVLTRQELLDYVTVNRGERFAFGSVYYNQVRDVHPPLYYWLFHFVCSLFPGVFSLWPGLLLDLLLYLLCAVLLYRLARTLFDSRFTAAAVTALYGLSVTGLSTMLMIRMYVLMTALTLWLALLIAQLMKRPRPSLYPLVGLCILLGLMTQYYFVFYAFFVCAAYVFWALAKRRFKSAGLFALCAFAGAGLLLLCFPACLDHLFAEKLVSGGGALDNLLNFSAWRRRLDAIIRPLRFMGLRAARYTAIALLAALLPCCRGLLRAVREKRVALGPALVILLPALLVFPLAIIIAPVVETRYVYNLIPLLVLLVGLLLYLLEQSLGRFSREALWKNAAVLLILALALWQARCVPPDYLYPEYRDYDALAAAHAQSPCVYLDAGYSAPLTQDLQQLLFFADVFVTGDPDSAALADYLAGRADAAECVVYVDVSATWSSGFRPEELLPSLLAATDFSAFSPLYENELSAAYLLSK